MMHSREIVKKSFGGVRKALKAQGFYTQGSTLCRRAASGNTELVSLQKSVRSSEVESLVTINYGVHCACIGDSRGEEPSATVDLSRAHWRERWTEGGNEKWLLVRSSDDADETARILLAALDGIVLPRLARYSVDEALRDAWLEGSSPGITEMQRLLFLALLLKKTGPAEHLESVVEELRGKVKGTVHAGLVNYNLEKAGIRVKR